MLDLIPHLSLNLPSFAPLVKDGWNAGILNSGILNSGLSLVQSLVGSMAPVVEQAGQAASQAADQLGQAVQAGQQVIQEGGTKGANLKTWAYVGFVVLVLIFLALDLGVFHREAHEVSMKEATIWSVIWLTCGVAFTAFIFYGYNNHWLGLGLDTPKYNQAYDPSDPASKLIITGEVLGSEAAKQYLVGYVVEKSLAMDNIFVIAIIFSFFAIPAKYQHRVLFWGIVGALIMRGAMIFLGAELILKYQWILIIFGGFLILTSLKMAIVKGHSDPGSNPVVRLVKKLYPITDFFDGQKFFTRRTLKPTYSIDPATGKERQDPPPAGSLGRLAITPLFLALIMVEITDLVFAVDSIPAIFAITPDPFIVFTSNIFAILGLRALYFCLAALIAKFRFLKPALILILAFVGVKLLLLSVPPYLDVIGLEAGKPIKIDTFVSLIAVLGTLALATVLSILLPSKAQEHLPSPAGLVNLEHPPKDKGKN
ncbi:MAG: TerC family protein [Planctomycetota bacterium]|nr:TerC family protein [Planctomycetota bacterium]